MFLRYSLAILVSTLIAIPGSSFCQPTSPAKVAGIPVNYDEANVGMYTLPDPLTLKNGKKITDTTNWLKKRRPEIVKLI